MRACILTLSLHFERVCSRVLFLYTRGNYLEKKRTLQFCEFRRSSGIVPESSMSYVRPRTQYPGVWVCPFRVRGSSIWVPIQPPVPYPKVL